MRRWLLGTCLAICCVAPEAAEHATILLYHRVSDTGPASTRVTPARFREHLDLIEARGYRVLPLATVLSGVFEGGKLPERALAITFDDAYRSVGDVAYPLLRERGMPFTVFVATDAVDDHSPALLDWGSLRAMAADKLVSFGPHSRSHAHLEDLGHPGDVDSARAARGAEIDGSLARLRAQLGEAVIAAFAYPYGEYSLTTESLLAARGLYGLAQQSGAVGPTTSRTRIPRFPLYVGGDERDRLLTALSARPLPVTEQGNREVFFAPGTAAPQRWRFRPDGAGYVRDALRCYAASGVALELTFAGQEAVVSLPPLQPGRNKVNCTAPAVDGGGYFWHSRLWLVADTKGHWLRE